MIVTNVTNIVSGNIMIIMERMFMLYKIVLHNLGIMKKKKNIHKNYIFHNGERMK